MNRLDAVFEWNMTHQEADAFKLCVLWEEVTKKMFPDIFLAKIPAKNDPRKCNLFRHCWKLARETRGLLREEEYKLYITANLQIIKAHNGRIEPNSLCGDKAWIRWKVWKRLYDKKVAELKGEQTDTALSVSPKIVVEIDKTKKFLYEKCDGSPTKEKIAGFMERKMKMWVNLGKVSYYYIVLSPWVEQSSKIEDLEKSYIFDASLYKGRADASVISFFKKEFAHEYT